MHHAALFAFLLYPFGICARENVQLVYNQNYTVHVVATGWCTTVGPVAGKSKLVGRFLCNSWFLVATKCVGTSLRLQAAGQEATLGPEP
jgi:hypothetical protein